MIGFVTPAGEPMVGPKICQAGGKSASFDSRPAGRNAIVALDAFGLCISRMTNGRCKNAAGVCFQVWGHGERHACPARASDDSGNNATANASKGTTIH